MTKDKFNLTAALGTLRRSDYKALNELLLEFPLVGNAAVDVLIDEGADPDAKDRFGKTGLYTAAWMGHADVVRTLINRAATVDVKFDFDVTALDIAILQRDETIVGELRNATKPVPKVQRRRDAV
jgi:ankyrin repeat protein